MPQRRSSGAPGAVGARRALILAYLVVQLTIPAVLLSRGGRSPAHWAWQMFSRVEKSPWIRVVFADRVDSTTVTNQRNSMRADLQLPPDFARQICAHYPAATAVRIGDAPEVRCR